MSNFAQFVDSNCRNPNTILAPQSESVAHIQQFLPFLPVLNPDFGRTTPERMCDRSPPTRESAPAIRIFRSLKLILALRTTLAAIQIRIPRASHGRAKRIVATCSDVSRARSRWMRRTRGRSLERAATITRRDTRRATACARCRRIDCALTTALSPRAAARSPWDVSASSSMSAGCYARNTFAHRRPLRPNARLTLQAGCVPRVRHDASACRVGAAPDPPRRRSAVRSRNARACLGWTLSEHRRDREARGQGRRRTTRQVFIE